MRIIYAAAFMLILTGCSKGFYFMKPAVDDFNSVDTTEVETTEVETMSEKETMPAKSEEGAASDLLDIAPSSGRKVFLLEGGVVDYETFRA